MPDESLDRFDELIEDSLRRSEELSDQQECMQKLFANAIKVIEAECECIHNGKSRTVDEELRRQLFITKSTYDGMKKGYINTRVPLGAALAITVIANVSCTESLWALYCMRNSVKVSKNDNDLLKVLNACIKVLSRDEFRTETYIERLGRLNDVLEERLKIKEYKVLNEFKTKAEKRQEKWRKK